MQVGASVENDEPTIRVGGDLLLSPHRDHDTDEWGRR